MTSTNTKTGEAGRLEELSAGALGNASAHLNLQAYDRRRQLELPLIDEPRTASQPEIGAPVGRNPRRRTVTRLGTAA